MIVPRQIPLLLLCLLLPTWLAATSRTIFGIVVESSEDEDPQAVVRILWDSYCRDPEGDMRIQTGKRWDGCVFRLDGREVTAAQAVAPGRLLWCHFNRQSLRVVECWTLPEGRLAQLRPEGEGLLIAQCRGALVYGQERKGEIERRTADCWLHVAVDGAQPRVIATAPAFSPVAYQIEEQQLAVAEGRLSGTLRLRIPVKPSREAPEPEPLQADYRIDLPLAGGIGSCIGRCGTWEVEAEATVQAHAPPPLPETAVAWISLAPDAEQITLRFADGVALGEGAALLHSKGHITASVDSVDGRIDATSIAITATAGERSLMLQGSVCGDMLGGEWRDGERTGRFVGRLLPADVVPHGHIGHRDQDIPPRTKPTE